MPARHVGINLLPKTEFEISFWGRFLKWAISTGRYILILVELVVIIAFLSRFKLDKDLADLADSITGKKAVLVAAYQTEQNFRVTQARINAAGKILGSQTNVRQLTEVVNGYVPPDMILSQATFEPNQVTVSGETSQQSALAIFLSRMTSDPIWSRVELNEILATPTEGIKFTVTAKK